jgi:hypothetical protein
MLSTNEMEAYWTSAQARIDDVLLPLAIKVKCFPEGTTTETLPKRYAESLRAAKEKPQVNGPKHKATQGLWLLSWTCEAGRTLARQHTEMCANLKDVLTGSDGAIAMSLMDETFLQSHEDFFDIFEQYAPRLVGYLEAMNDVSQQNVERVRRGDASLASKR